MFQHPRRLDRESRRRDGDRRRREGDLQLSRRRHQDFNGDDFKTIRKIG